MELRDAEALAREEMAKHLRYDATFRWNNGVSMLGQAVHNRSRGLRFLELSRKYAAISDRETVLDTVRHEIAHLNVGLEHGHDRVWKLEAIRLGASPSRVANPATTPNLRKEAAPWRGSCPNGHDITPLWRKPRVTRSCSKCSPTFNAAYIITYRRVDTGIVTR